MWELAKKNPLFAVIIVAVLIVVLSGAVDGIGARREASRYFDMAKGWATAYNRDIAATKTAYEERIKVLTADRDAYRDRWKAAKSKMDSAWRPPANPGEIEERFLKMGYRGRMK